MLEDHRKVQGKTFDLMTSTQMKAFDVEKEPEEAKERYGKNNFGQGCLLARRLVEAGVPFAEVDLGGWDNHQGIFRILENDRLPGVGQSHECFGRRLVAARPIRGYLHRLDG